jgi:hypothetical protein
MPVPIPLVMGGMIIASERIRPAWREPARAPFTGAGSIQGAWPRRSAGRPSGAGDPDGRALRWREHGSAAGSHLPARSQDRRTGSVAEVNPAGGSARLRLERAEKARGHNSPKPGMPSSFCLGYHPARWNVGDPTRRLKTCPWSRARPERGLKGIIIRRASDLTTTSIREHDPADDRR